MWKKVGVLIFYCDDFGKKHCSYPSLYAKETNNKPKFRLFWSHENSIILRYSKNSEMLSQSERDCSKNENSQFTMLLLLVMIHTLR